MSHEQMAVAARDGTLATASHMGKADDGLILSFHTVA